MSRILITGVNPVQCGKRPKLDYVSAVIALQKGLELGGHQVEVRQVVLGEDFQVYDRVVVFLASMRGFLCVETLGTLWAIYAGGEKVTISFDDWQVPQAISGIKSFAIQREKIISENPFGYKQIDKFGDFKEKLWAGLDLLIKDVWQWPVLVPVYKGGNLSMFKIPESKIFPYNPSVIFKGKYGWVESGTVKNKTWILAALHNYETWIHKQGLKWPVTQYGHRKSKQERLTESQIYLKYAESWGVLSPAYKISGSGWWRARYGFAADALSVIAGNPVEMRMVDTMHYPVASFAETCSDDELLELATVQRESYYTAAGTVEEMQADILASMPHVSR